MLSLQFVVLYEDSVCSIALHAGLTQPDNAVLILWKLAKSKNIGDQPSAMTAHCSCGFFCKKMVNW